MLASDGLEAVVSDEEIEAVMRSTDDLGEIADVLIQMTLDGGAPDNVTVVVVQVIDREELPADEPVGPSALPETGEIDTSLTTSELEEITEEVNAEEGLSDHDRALKKFRRARDLWIPSLTMATRAIRMRCTLPARMPPFCATSLVLARISWWAAPPWQQKPGVFRR